MKSFASGLLGEIRAAQYLKKQGMRIAARRFRAAGGEIDLIARDGHTLVFVEVKSRPNGRIGEGAAAVDRDKKRRLRSAARAYLARHPQQDVRFDVVELSAAGLRHIRNAL